jgi:hypothetical protein
MSERTGLMLTLLRTSHNLGGKQIREEERTRRIWRSAFENEDGGGFVIVTVIVKVDFSTAFNWLRSTTFNDIYFHYKDLIFTSGEDVFPLEMILTLFPFKDIGRQASARADTILHVLVMI